MSVDFVASTFVSCTTAWKTTSPTISSRWMDSKTPKTTSMMKLIKAFNDDKAPLIFTAKAPIPADPVTALFPAASVT